MTIEYTKLLNEYLRFRNDINPATAKTATWSINRFVQWIGVRPVTAQNVEMFAADMAKRHDASYAGRLVKHVQYFTAWMTKAGYLKEDPGIGAKRPRVHAKVPKTGFTREEYLRLKEFFKEKPEMRTFVIIAFHTGMSMIDVCKLTWGEVNLDKMLITRVRQKMASRNRATSMIPIISGTDLELELRRLALLHPTGHNCYVDPNLAAFHMGMTAGGNQMGNTLKWYLHSACKKLGIDTKGTHGFRRGLLSKLANDPDMNLVHATAVSGHRNVNMLKRYVTTDPAELLLSVEGPMRKYLMGDVEKIDNERNIRESED